MHETWTKYSIVKDVQTLEPCKLERSSNILWRLWSRQNESSSHGGADVTIWNISPRSESLVVQFPVNLSIRATASGRPDIRIELVRLKWGTAVGDTLIGSRCGSVHVDPWVRLPSPSRSPYLQALPSRLDNLHSNRWRAGKFDAWPTAATAARREYQHGLGSSNHNTITRLLTEGASTAGALLIFSVLHRDVVAVVGPSLVAPGLAVVAAELVAAVMARQCWAPYTSNADSKDSAAHRPMCRSWGNSTPVDWGCQPGRAALEEKGTERATPSAATDGGMRRRVCNLAAALGAVSNPAGALVERVLFSSALISIAGRIWRAVHASSAALAEALADLTAVGLSYTCLARQVQLGKLPSGRTQETAWRRLHKAGAQRLARHLGDLPETPPLAPVLAAMQCCSIAAGMVVDGMPLCGALDAFKEYNNGTGVSLMLSDFSFSGHGASGLPQLRLSLSYQHPRQCRRRPRREMAMTSDGHLCTEAPDGAELSDADSPGEVVAASILPQLNTTNLDIAAVQAETHPRATLSRQTAPSAAPGRLPQPTCPSKIISAERGESKNSSMKPLSETVEVEAASAASWVPDRPWRGIGNAMMSVTPAPLDPGNETLQGSTAVLHATSSPHLPTSPPTPVRGPTGGHQGPQEPPLAAPAVATALLDQLSIMSTVAAPTIIHPMSASVAVEQSFPRASSLRVISSPPSPPLPPPLPQPKTHSVLSLLEAAVAPLEGYRRTCTDVMRAAAAGEATWPFDGYVPEGLLLPPRSAATATAASSSAPCMSRGSSWDSHISGETRMGPCASVATPPATATGRSRPSPGSSSPNPVNAASYSSTLYGCGASSSNSSRVLCQAANQVVATRLQAVASHKSTCVTAGCNADVRGPSQPWKLTPLSPAAELQLMWREQEEVEALGLPLYGRSDHIGGQQLDRPMGLKEWWDLTCRAVYLLAVFAPFLTLGVLLLLLAAALTRQGSATTVTAAGSGGRLSARLALHGRRYAWQLLLGGCRRSGAAFIKWGQWAATRVDLFPDEFCEALSQLHDSAPTHSFAFTRHQVERAFGVPTDVMFEEFEPRPVASGSIAQVHRALMRSSDGSTLEVAVKVVHPNVKLRIRQDFSLMQSVALALGRLPSLRSLSLTETVSQFSRTMTAQVDLRVEAAHLRRFHRNFNQVASQVTTPRPLPGLTRSEVLVETWEEGRSVAAFIREPSPLNTAVVCLGVDTYLKMLLQDNFVHTDLHPGNIMVRLVGSDGRPLPEALQGPLLGAAAPPPTGTGAVAASTNILQCDAVRVQLVLLDFGLAEELTPTVRHHFISFLHHIMSGDGAAAASHLLRWTSRPQSCPNPAAFTAAMKALTAAHDVHSAAGIDLNAVMKAVLRLARQHAVTIDSCYTSLVITVCVIVGFATSLDPLVNLVDAAVPALLAHSLTGRVVGRLYS